jgi:calcium/calmodulin-dependent protein kinase I
MIKEIEKIGEGSFGRVYKALDLTDRTLCAVKVLNI